MVLLRAALSPHSGCWSDLNAVPFLPSAGREGPGMGRGGQQRHGTNNKKEKKTLHDHVYKCFRLDDVCLE